MWRNICLLMFLINTVRNPILHDLEYAESQKNFRGIWKNYIEIKNNNWQIV